MTARATPPVRIIRRAILAAMVLLVIVVTALFVLGRSSRPAAHEETNPDAEDAAQQKGKKSQRQAAGEGEAAVLSEGFDYEQQVDGQPVFRLQGDRFTTDKEGKVALQGVRLELFRDGQPYNVASRRANYDPKTHNAQLIGAVRLHGADGWALDSDRLDLVGGGHVVVSRGGRVKIRRGQSLAGHASRLQFDLRDENLRLFDDVHFEGQRVADGSPFTLDAQKVVWARDANTVDAETGVELTWADDSLRAEHVHAALLPNDGGLQAANAEGSVEGRLVGEAGETVTVAAERAGISFDESTGRPRQIDLGQGESRRPVRLISEAPAASRRSLTAAAINADLRDGRLAKARASGGVVLEESGGTAGAARVLRGDELEAEFAARNEIRHAVVHGGVVLQDDAVSAFGDRAVLDQADQVVTLQGKPARVKNGRRSDLSAPRIVYALDRREAQAEGGVQGSFVSGSAILPSGGAAEDRSQPIHVEAESASFSEETKRFRFAGKVQAVQGETLLFADLLEGDQSAGTAHASGKVKTLWRDPHAKPGQGDGLTMASAEELDYDKEAGEIRYRGAVAIRQDRREIQAEATRVELDSEQHARRLLATGAVRIDDRETGRTVEGAEVDYDLVAKTGIVTGEPVIIRDRDGTVLRGRRAFFDSTTGSARILSEAD